MDVSWTIKKAKHRRMDAFELWCWRRLYWVPGTARRSNQSIWKEINPDYSLDAEAPILWPPDGKSQLIGKDLDAGIDWGQEEKGVAEDEMVGWHHWLIGMRLNKLWETVEDRGAWHATVYEVAKSRTQVSNWTAKQQGKLRGKGLPVCNDIIMGMTGNEWCPSDREELVSRAP